ncbi:MAG: hypothetical protein ACRDCY_08700 [Aeromonas veronii]
MIHSSYVSNYDKFPEVVVAGHEGAAWHAIARRLQAVADGQGGEKVVLVIDCYHGVDQDELRSQLLTRFGSHTLIDVEQARLPEPKVLAMLERFITDDRVFGVLAPHKMVEFFEPVALARLQLRVQSRQIYVFSHAALLGWYEGGELAERCAKFGMRHFDDGAGNQLFSLNADGSPADTSV